LKYGGFLVLEKGVESRELQPRGFHENSSAGRRVFDDFFLEVRPGTWLWSGRYRGFPNVSSRKRISAAIM
jgi:hypothetical protein